MCVLYTCSALGVKFVFLFDLFFFVLPVGVGIFLEERVREMGKVYGNICRCVIAFLGGPGTTLSSGMGWDLSPGGESGRSSQRMGLLQAHGVLSGFTEESLEEQWPVSEPAGSCQ